MEHHETGNSDVVPVKKKYGYDSPSIFKDTDRYYHDLHKDYLIWVAAGDEANGEEGDTTEILLPGLQLLYL